MSRQEERLKSLWKDRESIAEELSESYGTAHPMTSAAYSTAKAILPTLSDTWAIFANHKGGVRLEHYNKATHILVVLKVTHKGNTRMDVYAG